MNYQEKAYNLRIEKLFDVFQVSFFVPYNEKPTIENGKVIFSFMKKWYIADNLKSVYVVYEDISYKKPNNFILCEYFKTIDEVRDDKLNTLGL